MEINEGNSNTLANILQIFCKNCAKLFFVKFYTKNAQKFCKIFTKFLHIFCEKFAKFLQKMRKNFSKKERN